MMRRTHVVHTTDLSYSGQSQKAGRNFEPWLVFDMAILLLVNKTIWQVLRVKSMKQVLCSDWFLVC